MAAWLMGFLFWFHPYYVNVVEINHNTRDQNIEISVRVFTDDFEKTLRTFYPGKKVDLQSQTLYPTMEKLVNGYVWGKLALEVNGKTVNYQWLGFEVVEESVWAYFEAPFPEKIKELVVHNKLLHEYQKNQINMHHITVDEQRKSTKLDNPESKAVFQF